MAGINKVIVLGRLAKDVDIRYMPSGEAVANLTVVTSETWNDKQTGEKKEKSEFHKVVIFGKLADVADKYLAKGSQVYIEGKLQTRKWQNQQGQDQYTTEIVVQGFGGAMQMLGGNKQQGQQAQQNSGYNQAPQQQQEPQQGNHLQQQANYAQQQASQQQSVEYDDDIPFDLLCRKPMAIHCV